MKFAAKQFAARDDPFGDQPQYFAEEEELDQFSWK